MAKYFLLPKRTVDRIGWVQTPAWLIEAGFFYLLLGISRLLPYRIVASAFAALIGSFGYRNEKKRRVVRRNVAVILPQASDSAREAVVRQIFRATGLAAAELFLLGRLWRRRARFLEFSVHPEAQAAIARKDAIVFVTAHVGAWQLCNLIGREAGLTISVLYAAEPNPWMRRFFLGRRRAFGGPLVPSQGGVRAFLNELAAGRSVGAAFDTRVDQGEMVPLFGVATPTSTLPAMLALRGHPMIPIRTRRLSDCRFRIEVLAPLLPADPQAPREAKILDLTTRMNQVFEDWIREDPGQWICLKRRWPKAAASPRTPDV